MAEKISVSLEQKHIRAIERYGKKIGVSAFSTALQALIHRFEQIEQSETSTTEKPDVSRTPDTVAA